MLVSRATLYYLWKKFLSVVVAGPNLNIKHVFTEEGRSYNWEYLQSWYQRKTWFTGWAADFDYGESNFSHFFSNLDNLLEQGFQSQIHRFKLCYKPRAELIQCLLKHIETTAHSLLNQYRTRCILFNDFMNNPVFFHGYISNFLQRKMLYVKWIKQYCLMALSVISRETFSRGKPQKSKCPSKTKHVP